MVESNIEFDMNIQNDESVLFQNLEEECADKHYKIILLGDKRVGKTSIINRFVNN